MGKATRYLAETPKWATNVSIDEMLLKEPKELQVNVSRAAEFGLMQAIAEKRAEFWVEENREALVSSNEDVEKHGLPLAKYRQF
ncbi:type II toxin-antitoxin system CcdA family antitoxin [Skermanella sp. TT6]|uniref:Type II toxin-antitoxin system CcdA family antitoxin n=1 Tax=Skermanella cutis TaxID=2775420 RepID=A0ABX7B7T2_9PROT|nr:type II toxin-antitoxin system CcdA family antitoxin [Skermanella sp. TT6]QQP90237.1 type II toxin-antitoxin system CcdA family antitoxin [Skermanella sp. TT6]